MKNVLWLLCCMWGIQVMAQTPYTTTPEMLFGDTTRIGLPFAKDPYVIKWNKRYLSIIPYLRIKILHIR
jgi:beta-1,2-mannobiose phosphorylase / 1,2-beta-oligomannan phosphorylase